MIKKVIKKIGRNIAIFLYYIMYYPLPVKKDMIVFNCSMGRNYTGSPRYIYEYMVEKGLDKKYQCIWVFRNTRTKIPGNGKIAAYGRLRYLYYMAVAGIWVFDCRQPKFLKKKKGVSYIQTWHGTPLKKLALDMDSVAMAGGSDIEKYKKEFTRDSSMWDYLISQNPFSSKIFRRCFDFHKTLLEFGYPRNDMLINENREDKIRQLKESWGLPGDKKIILYAPTWRDDEFSTEGAYQFRPKLDFSLLKEALQEDYVMIVKYHYLINDSVDWSPYSGFVCQFDASYDISGMYLVSDMLITDYSSVMFDYSVLKRPILFYCYDLEKYKNQLRGFYFDFQKEAPGPISETTQALIADIIHYRARDYEEKYKAFSEKYNPWDDGQASGKVVDLIERL